MEEALGEGEEGRGWRRANYSHFSLFCPHFFEMEEGAFKNSSSFLFPGLRWVGRGRLAERKREDDDGDDDMEREEEEGGPLVFPLFHLPHPLSSLLLASPRMKKKDWQTTAVDLAFSTPLPPRPPP